MKLTIVGCGYVGLVTGVCLAELGHDVTCVDNNADKIAMLGAGKSPIFEPGLEPLIEKNMAAGRLRFTPQLAQAVSQADVVMIAVGTPPDESNKGKADLSAVFRAAQAIAPALRPHSVVVTKSTVPVGTGKQIQAIIERANPHAQCAVASNPEFLREGSAIADFMNPDRIVIGTQCEAASHLLADLYQPLTNQGYPLLRTDLETAEMIKYASNSFLATKIAFINEMADICEQVGANVEQVAKGMGMDTRIGEKFLQPGPGFGGSCFPKDAMALAQLAQEHGVEPAILNSVIAYNLNRRISMAQRVIEACGGSVQGKRIAVLGLTFKANTDDMRESASLALIPALLKAGAHLQAYDPEGMANAKLLLRGDIQWSGNAMDALSKADACVIVTEWQQFRDLDWTQARAQMQQPLIIDLRNLFAPDAMARQGFDYYSIGRKPALRDATHASKSSAA